MSSLYELLPEEIKKDLEENRGEYANLKQYFNITDFETIKGHCKIFEYDNFNLYVPYDRDIVFKYDKTTGKITNMVYVYDLYTTKRVGGLGGQDLFIAIGHEDVLLLNPYTFEKEEIHTR